MKKNKILIVGAGLSGAIIARELCSNGFSVDLIEARDYVGGNCHTQRNTQTGVMVHTHGPHIFHTNNINSWNYVNQFAEFMPYTTHVKATVKNRVYSLPINLLTINQFFNKTFSPKEAEDFLASKANKLNHQPVTFEEQALAFLGTELYEAFFKGYPIKQWGLHPRELPASILKRLPVRFNYNDNYFDHQFQGIPKEGYTSMIEKILSHQNLSVSLNTKFDKQMRDGYSHTFFSGPLDEWFDYKLGSLGYRTLKFEHSVHEGDFQGCAVMSYPDENIPYTRITEHKHFAPWESHTNTIISKEYSSLCQVNETPYYPIRLVNEKKLLSDYVSLCEHEKKVSFVGRLGTYRYLDMDVTVSEALAATKKFIELITLNKPIPIFFNHPFDKKV